MTTWAEVESNSEYQKLPPEQKEAARAQYFDQVVAPKVPKEQLQTVRAQFDRDTTSQEDPKKIKTFDQGMGVAERALETAFPIAMPAAEAGMSVASGMAAQPVAGVAGLASGAVGGPAADTVHDVESALTYQPRSVGGQAAAGLLAKATQPVEQGTDWAGEKVSQATGSPALGALTKTALQALPMALTKGAGRAIGRAGEAATRAVAGAPSASAAESAAQSYIGKNTSLDWASLPEAFKKRITQIAEDGEALNKLDPKMVERQGRFETLQMPYTRGHVTRDLADVTREKNVTKSTTGGAPIRAINAAQDVRFDELMQDLRKETGAKTSTRQQLGKSVQDDALRAKEKASKDNYDDLYRTARTTEPDATTSPAELYEYLEKNPEVQHLGFMQTWLNKAKIKSTAEPAQKLDVESKVSDALKQRGKSKPDEIQIRDVELNELDDLRKKAVGIAKKGGTDAHYAGEIVGVINRIFDKIPASAKNWIKARDAFKAHQVEFKDQSALQKMVGQKSRTDRKTALADTLPTILKEDVEGIEKIHKSLVEGGTEKTRAVGAQAWKDFQGAVLDHLTEVARGPREIRGEAGQHQFNSTFRDEFIDLDKDGKIEAIFGPKIASRLREINEAVGDARTTPSGRIPGSDTAANFKAAQTLSALEKLSTAPVLGARHVAGAAKLIGQIGEFGKESRDVARAKRTPVDESAAESARKSKKRQRRENTLKSLKRAAPVATMTLEERDQP